MKTNRVSLWRDIKLAERAKTKTNAKDAKSNAKERKSEMRSFLRCPSHCENVWRNGGNSRFLHFPFDSSLGSRCSFGVTQGPIG